MMYNFNSNPNHCLLSELPTASTRFLHFRFAVATHPLEFEECQGVERPNLQDVSCRHKSVCGMTFHTPCLTPERWIGLWEQSTVNCLIP